MTRVSRSVFITGADGFIGSHLAEACVRRGDRVRALVQYNAFQHRGWLDQSKLTGAMEIISGDIRDKTLMRTLCRGQHVVFHLAALVAVPWSYQAPESYVATNIEGSLSVLLAAREAGCLMVHCSSSEVYGTAQTDLMDESHPLSAQSPYAASKIAADQLVLAFHASFDQPVVIARPFNNYGPRQSPRALIPTIILQFLRQTPVLKLGHLEPRRDFVFVQDSIRAFLALAECPAAVGQTVQWGTESAISVGELVKLIAARGGYPVPDIDTVPLRRRPSQSEVWHLKGSYQKMHRLTGWYPTVALEQGLETCLEWYREHQGQFSREFVY